MSWIALVGFLLFPGFSSVMGFLVIMPNALRREHLEKYTFAMQTAFSQRLSQCIFAAKLTKLIQTSLSAKC